MPFGFPFPPQGSLHLMTPRSHRPAHQHRFEVPSRQTVAARLDALIANDDATSRSETADWAMEYIEYDDRQIYPEIRDAEVREVLHALSGADTPTTDRPF